MKLKKSMALILSFVISLTMAGINIPSVFAATGQSVKTAQDVTLSGSGTEEAPYEIGTAEAFAAMPTENAGKYFELTDDITVTAPYGSGFSGIFNGNGYTVTLAIESAAANTALFSSLKGGATVRNLVTNGSVSVTENKSYAAGIAAQANGFENSGISGVTVENCRNEASISGYKAVGGIIGMSTNGVTIKGCTNKGNITGGNTQIGGIVGNAAGDVTAISNSYNTGTVTGFNMVGGIIGQSIKSSAKESLVNCYGAGNVSITSTNADVGSLTGNKSSSGTFQNCYVLDSAATTATGSGTNPEGVSSKTAEEMKAAAFITTLGAAFEEDSNNINNGYPVLAWEKVDDTAPKATVNFTVTPADAVIKVDKKTIDGASAVLKAGTHSYQISAEGFKIVNGTFDVTEAQAAAEETINLEAIVLPALDHITVTGYAASYYQGDELTGLIVKAVYADESEAEVTGYTTDFDSSEATEEKTVTVTYQGKTASFTVSILEKASILTPLAGKVEVTLVSGETYGFEEDADNGWLVTNNQGKGNSEATMKMKALQAGLFTFKYKVGSETNYDKFTVSAGSDVLVDNKSGEIDWTEQSVILAAGDEVTFAYKKDFSGDKNGDSVWIKDLAIVPAYTITLEATPANASVILKDSKGQAVSGNNGVYMVTNGTYTCTVSAFGYETKTETIEVKGADVTKSISLTELPSLDVLFAITLPEGHDSALVQTEVKSGETVIEPAEANKYTLPAGEYTYTVSHPQCVTVTGNFTVEGSDQTITVNLVHKDSVLDSISGKMEVTLASGTYGFTENTENSWLVTNNQGKGSSEATMKMKALQAGLFTFKYKVGSETNYDKFTVSAGSDVLINNASGEIDWTEQSVILAAGDELTFTYKKDYGGDANGDSVWIKDLSMKPVRTVTFQTTPENAAVVLKDREEKEIAPRSDRTYILPEGTYSYTVSAFGYEDKSGSVTVFGENVTETVALTKLATKNIQFQVTLPEGMDPAEVAVTVKSGETTVEAAEAMKYVLPAGAYTYTVSHPQCDDTEGSFTVGEEDQTVEVTLLRTLTLADFISSGIVTAANDSNYPYKGVYNEDGNYLESTNTGNYTVASVTLTFSAPAKLSFDYWTKVSSSTSYGVTVSKGSTVISRFNGEHDWTGYTINAAAGETIQIKYERQYNEAAENKLRLQNFVITPIYDVAFTVPDGASVVLKNGEEEIKGSGNTFTVANGTYSYTVSKFGFEDKEGTVTVEGAAQTVTVADGDMTKLPSKTIRFKTNPEDAQVTVTHRTAGVIKADASGVYDLPAGESFSYVIEKENYLAADGTFTVSDDREITATLTYAGEAWDGTTKTQPETGAGTAEAPYVITTGAELAWVAEQVNAGNGTISVKLDANINLGGKTWTGIGNYTTNYGGTFDGNGKTVSGLSGSTGLFDTTGADSVVRDLTVAGSVSGSSNVGGVVSTCSGTLENVLFSGNVTNSNTYSTGGLVGRLQRGGKLTGCISKGTVRNTTTYAGSTINTGGLVGYSYGEIRNCYSACDVFADTSKTTNTAVGGFVGQNYADGSIRDCYSAGEVSGPEEGTFDFAGVNAGTIDNAYAIETSGGKATTKVTKKTSAYMKSDSFVVDLGADSFNRDSEEINRGFAILKWQGGSAVEDPAAIDVAAAKNALKLQGKKGEETFEIKADGDDYNLRPGSVDTLILPSAGENGTQIAWTQDVSGCIDLANGTVTAPETGKTAVTLTAQITKGHASAEKLFAVSIWSEQAVAAEELDTFAAKLADRPVVASQIAHPEDVTVGDVVKRALAGFGFNTDGLSASFVSVEGDNANFADDGTITYFKGETSLNYALYQNCVKVKLAKNGAEKECTLKQIRVSWDKTHVQNLLNTYRDSITWDAIKGERSNTAEFDAAGSIPKYTVAGYVEGSLNLPAKAQAASVAWTAVSGSDNAEIGSVAYDDSLNLYYPCTLTPSEEEAVHVTLQAALTFNKLNDEDKAEGAEEITSKLDIALTIERNDNPGIDKQKVQNALDEQYLGMIRDFVEKEKAVDPTALTDDIQLPTPGDLEKTDILPDRDNEQVVMESSNEDVLRVYGNHCYVYRPLPGEDDAEVQLTVSIRNRINGSTVATTTKTLKVKAFTQAEIDAAAEEMQTVATDDIYWEGLASGTNNTKDNVTENLNSYKEIWKTDFGYEYVKGKDTNSSFIALEDLPGYDPMGTQKWRTLRSSNEDVIKSENLLVTRPEDVDEEVTIDSVMSYVKYANYWERFGVSDTATPESKLKYAAFEQFYKIPVSVTVTVTAPHVHQMIHYEAKEATEEAAGNIEYWKCAGCGKLFADEGGMTELTEDVIMIPKKEAVEPAPKPAPKPDSKLSPLAVGKTFTSGGNKYKVISVKASASEVTLIKGAKKASVKVPAAVRKGGIAYKVTSVSAKAFKKNKNVKKVIVGANVRKIGARAFAKCKKLKVLTIRSTKLNKASVRKALAGSKIKVIKVKVGNKALNKKFVKKYKKIFTKKNCGRKVVVR